MVSPLRTCALFALSLTAATAVSAQQAPTYDVYAVRYATIAGFPVRGLIAGADTSRRMDIAMTVWLLRGNGRTVLVATADGVADSVALVVAQEAVAARAEQDTVVALAPGAVRLGAGAPLAGPAQFTVVRVDANGEEAPSPEPLVVTNLDPARIDVAHLPGDTVRVTGLAPGDASITVAFGSFSTAMRVQVVSAYAVITVNASQDGIFLSPSSVTIPVGAAVLFRNGETASVGATGSGWRVGPVAGGTYEGQLFTVPGTYTFTSGSANGTVVVSP